MGVKDWFWAHNPKVVGSNPAPATIINDKGLGKILGPFLIFDHPR